MATPQPTYPTPSALSPKTPMRPYVRSSHVWSEKIQNGVDRTSSSCYRVLEAGMDPASTKETR